MKLTGFFACLVLLSVVGQAQKPNIDSTVYGNWPHITSLALSNDGKYVQYTINNRPLKKGTLVLEAVDRRWKMEFPDAVLYSCRFTGDGRKALFRAAGDSLVTVTLGTSSIDYKPGVASFRTPVGGASDWVAFQKKTSSKELVVRSSSTNRQSTIDSVASYLFNNDGSILLIEREGQYKGAKVRTLYWLDLSENKEYLVFKGSGAGNFVFDESGRQLAFTVERKQDSLPAYAMRYYKAGMDSSISIVTDQVPGVESGLHLDRTGIQRFSADGGRIFFNLKRIPTSKKLTNIAKVDIWSYSDVKLQPEQRGNLVPESYLAVISLRDRQVIRLQQEDEFLILPGPGKIAGSDSVVVAVRRKGNSREWNWNPASRVSVDVVSTVTAVRKPVKVDVAEMYDNCTLSSSGKYVLYYDYKQRNYFSYSISSGIVRNITKGIAADWTPGDKDDLSSSYTNIGVAGWMAEDSAVLLYDRYDIWKVDPSGITFPVNVTNGYGRRHHLLFHLAVVDGRGSRIESGNVILNVFDKKTRNNGFYQKVIGKIGDPELLTMGPHIYGGLNSGLEISSAPIIKARDVNSYLVSRMSANESVNYYFTSDFKEFTPLSDVYPERNYNWLTTELMTWKTSDGAALDGILYKPENFDSRRKYPVILHYYERLSDKLNLFTTPNVSEDDINIPSFVSNGYLVFEPDIHFLSGKTGQSAYNSIISAAKFLSRLGYVDSTKIGLQGHSFGGYSTNYVITHSTFFAAAVSASGPSDFVSGYGAIFVDHSSQSIYEFGQNRINATLWQRPDLFIENSPIFRADKVKTPLLMMNNELDRVVQFTQGVEFFTALRRLGKKVWMLQYDGNYHSAEDEAAKDYSIRMTQFFDHYLKGMPAPRWMVEGVPASQKGIDSGLEIERQNSDNVRKGKSFRTSLSK